MADERIQDRITVDVEGRTLSVSNLDKVLYPSGFTKGEVLAYYTAVAPALLPHLAGRPLTLRRWPNGTAAPSFFEKNVARTAPGWVRTALVDTPGSTRDRETIDFVVVEELPSLVWVANLAGLELHVPQWRLGPDDLPLHPDLLVVDLDPGAPADLVDCCQVALLVRDALAADGLTLHPKTSGSKGLQGYAPLDAGAPWEDVHGYAKRVAERVEQQAPRQVVSRMEKSRRRGKVLVDWSQNHRAKTTVAPYSLRGLPEPTVSTPVTWAEVEAVADGADPHSLRFLAGDVVARVAELGDLLAPLLTNPAPLP